MSASVKLGEDAKRLLDQLQAKIVLAVGKKPSQEQLLDEIVKFSSEREEELILRMAGVKFPFSNREVDALLKRPRDWGIVTSEEEIDSTLYGKARRRK